MKKIEVLGSGCANCVRLAANAKEAATLAGVERILAVEATGGATIVRPHAGRASRFQPLVKG